ncbi:ATP-dependent DNA helicase [Pseudoglutamicibacter cumminsii]|uniref:DNA 5'-3' helicase n=1 Tax=Pseudoglutamicibacter cumminsii TaxID=156979 RepID=A0ABX5L6J0_9MICC|nr:ATP-dependent helicase [Pseudoglutamicibacter cumminsii]
MSPGTPEAAAASESATASGVTSASESATASADPAVQEVERLLTTAVDKMGGQRRDGQHEMAHAVAHALSSGRHLLVQAGTGTGKSLAYLIPAITHAIHAEKPVVVATATLALQSQVVGRDVPRLLKALEDELPRPVDVTLLKGRNNYACKYKLAGGYPEDNDAGSLFDASLADASAVDDGPTSPLGQEIMRIRKWAEESETGDRDELVPSVSDKAWRQVSVSSLECLGTQHCPMAEECFTERARGLAAESDVVVTNHAMLAFSAFEQLPVLPDFDVVIVDEAHELQDRVTNTYTRPLTHTAITHAAQGAKKHLKVASKALSDAAKAFEKSVTNIPTGLQPRGLTEAQRAAVTQVFESAKVVMSDSKREAGDAAPDGGWQSARSAVAQIVELCERLLNAGQGEEVVWASRPGSFEPGRGYVVPDDSEPASLMVAPLSVAMQMRDGLFEDRTVVLTSATLAVGEAFEPVAGGLGLMGPEAPEWDSVDVGSPFEYEKQGVLYVAQHLPPPGRGVSEEAIDELVDLIKASGGAALALFSSRRAAEDAAAACRERLDVPILVQGEASMTELVREFSADEQTCLFGTMTLWQGVDVPGRHCRLVVIDRIPFPRPDDPLMTARTRDVNEHGGNGFMSVSAHHAAIRLAQGVGRLIRSTEDRGVAAILDSRMATRRYGAYLRNVLPPLWTTTDRNTVLGALGRLREANK